MNGAEIPLNNDKNVDEFNSKKMNIKILLGIAVTMSIVIFAACKKDKFVETDGICPTVLLTNPMDGSTGVPLDQVITATFNVTMDPASVTEISFFVVGSVVPGKVVFSDKTASFTPDQPLLKNHTYVGHIKTSVMDLMGNHLKNEYTWTFSTGEILSPMVTLTEPGNLDEDVALNKTISATFNMPMSPNSIDSSFKLMLGTERIVGVFSYYDTTAYFIPAVPLKSGRTYVASISVGANSATGIPMQNEFVWSFTTRNDVSPQIIGTIPKDNDSLVSLNTGIAVDFDALMDQTSFSGSTFYLKEGVNVVPGVVSFNGNEAFFKPNNLLLSNKTYQFTVTTGVKNSVGIPITKDSTWSFKTGLVLAPTIVSTDPLNNAQNVALNKSITVNFSVAMDPLTMTAASMTLKQGANVISGTVSTVGAISTFTPTVGFTEGLVYTATISTAAKNLSGIPLSNQYTWKFTTMSIPKIIAVDPLNLATGVLLNKIINAEFNMPMDPATLTSATVVLKQGAAVITTGIGYSGSVLAIAPAVALLQNTTYTVTITTGAKNLSGIGLLADYVWSFTTGSIKAPTITSTNPINLAIDVTLNKIIEATFSEAMLTSSIASTSFLLKLGTTPVSGTVYMVNNTAYFKPTANLISGKTYTATVTNDAKNLAGIKMANSYTWTFKTKAPLGPTAPNLAGVARFGIIAGTAVSNNAGFSKINNLDVGIYPGFRSSITGFPPAVIVNGAMYAADDLTPVGVAAMLLQAKTDLTAAYLFAEGASTPAPASVSGDQGGKTLAPGIYKTTSTLLIQSGDLTLDAQGDVNAVWIFQIASSLTTVGGAGGNVILSGGAQAKNIYWQIGSSATIGGYTKFKGNILALTSITMGAYAVADGRMLASNAAVTMTSTNVINKP